MNTPTVAIATSHPSPPMGNDPSPRDARLVSLDALRGLDMFFLVGFAGIFRALPKLSDNEFFNWLAYQCSHPKWHGFTAYDVIFPMFIFIVGVAMPFSFSKRLQKEGGKIKLFKHVLLRATILSLVGVVLWLKPLTVLNPEYGWYSVLYRIGFSYLFAAVIMMNTGIRGQIAWAFGLLIGHWILLRFIPVPGYRPCQGVRSRIAS
jgi:predicted acyltransferase